MTLAKKANECLPWVLLKKRFDDHPARTVLFNGALIFCAYVMEVDVPRDQISPLELKQKLADGASLVILDVREPAEYQTARIEGSILIPLGELATRVEELDPDQEIVTLCHHGMRSQAGLDLLASKGFRRVKNLTGGIDAYAQMADPSIPRYR